MEGVDSLEVTLVFEQGSRSTDFFEAINLHVSHRVNVINM